MSRLFRFENVTYFDILRAFVAFASVVVADDPAR